LTKVWRIRRHLVAEFKPDVVIASSTYPFDTWVAKRLATAAGAKMVYEVHDLWPLTPIEVGGMNKWHPFMLAMQAAENFGYKHADKVVSLLPKARDYMQEHGMHPEKFVYLPNGVAVEDWQQAAQALPAQHHEFLAKLKQAGVTFILGYAGGMGEANALDYLLDAAKLLNDPTLAIVLIGDGPLRNRLTQRVAAENLRQVHFLPSIAKLQVPAFLAACDGLYIGWNKLPIYRFGICPNKLFDYMLAGKPIVHSVTAGNDLVNEANCGISVAAADVPAIVSAITHLSSLKPAELAKLGRNGYNYVLQNHDYRILATRFLDRLAN
jgi:glycosyltransferase involved in cell wall biosynthesis